MGGPSNFSSSSTSTRIVNGKKVTTKKVSSAIESDEMLIQYFKRGVTWPVYHILNNVDLLIV